MATTTGREVATGTLWMERGDDGAKVRVRVAARCGSSDCTYEGQIAIYDETGGDIGVCDKPYRVLKLSSVSEVTSLSNIGPCTANTLYGLPVDDHDLWGLMLLLVTGEAVELFADSRELQQQWIQYLNLLAMFPFSPIPEEPRNNPIRNSLRTKLKASNYDADSVWLVYVLAEEVGSRVQALGVNIVTLRSSLNKGSPALLSIISPLDSEPIITWEANKMRRTGSLGNLVFLEIGRRCEGGPGLIWMYSCPEDSINFRDTLKRFLFIGDGRPTNANTTSMDKTNGVGMYDKINSSITSKPASTSSSPSSSGGGSFKLTYNEPVPTVIKQSAEYDLADEDTLEYDYAFNTGPPGRGKRHSMTLPLSSTPPPINLGSHPSRKKETNSANHKRSLSIPGKEEKKLVFTETKVTPTFSSIDSGLSSAVSLEDDFQSIDESINMIMSELNDTCTQAKPTTSTADGLNDIIAELESFATSKTEPQPAPVKRSNTLPSNEKKPLFKRANSTSTCSPMHYMKLRNPKYDLMKEGYVVMGSGGRATMLDKVIEERSHTNNKRLANNQLHEQTDYVNHPLPQDIANAKSVIYQREYHNITHDSTVTQDDDEDSIYMNNDHAPTTKEEMAKLVSSAYNEIDNLQMVLDQFGID